MNDSDRDQEHVIIVVDDVYHYSLSLFVAILNLSLNLMPTPYSFHRSRQNDLVLPMLIIVTHHITPASPSLQAAHKVAAYTEIIHPG